VSKASAEGSDRITTPRARSRRESLLSLAVAAGPERELILSFLARATVTHAIDFFSEGVDVLEAAINGRKSHVRDFIEIMQLFHHELAHQSGGHFALTHGTQLVTDMHDRVIDRFACDRSLLERLQHAAAKFAFIERLTHVIAFDDARHDELSAFESRKPFVALQALAATPYLLALAREPRVDDFGLFEIAERTMHAEV